MSCKTCEDTFRVGYVHKQTGRTMWRKCPCQIPTKLYKLTMAQSSLSSWRSWQGDREDVDRLPFGLKLAISTGRRAGLSNSEIAILANLPLHVVLEVG